jgi:tetratricopeptide (TPR) repeat protein
VRAVELVDAGRIEEALALIDRALELQPASAALHLRRSNLLARLGREEEARAAYDRYVELQPFADAVDYGPDEP